MFFLFVLLLAVVLQTSFGRSNVNLSLKQMVTVNWLVILAWTASIIYQLWTGDVNSALLLGILMVLPFAIGVLMKRDERSLLSSIIISFLSVFVACVMIP